LIKKLKENISLQLKNNSSYFGFIHNTKFPIIMIAKWNGQALAESNDTVVVEGNHYFPKESINKEFFKESNTHSTCPWKGEASYYSIEVDGEINKDAAWYYPTPSKEAEKIKDRIAFWTGVEVVKE
jgi:uncharacterized protein (DUF427 family)